MIKCLVSLKSFHFSSLSRPLRFFKCVWENFCFPRKHYWLQSDFWLGRNVSTLLLQQWLNQPTTTALGSVCAFGAATLNAPSIESVDWVRINVLVIQHTALFIVALQPLQCSFLPVFLPYHKEMSWIYFFCFAYSVATPVQMSQISKTILSHADRLFTTFHNWPWTMDLNPHL